VPERSRIVFEDPSGVRILYDPGRTVDETDGRLGEVHVMLLSHAHSDHIGDARPTTANAGTCATPATTSALPNTVFVDIAAAKNAAVLAPGELSDFLARKIQTARGGATTPACPAVGLTSELEVPRSAPCTAALRPGGSRTVRRIGGSNGVRVAVVQAIHSNGINAAFVEAPGTAPGTTGYGGSEGGYVIQFTNGLSVYLTGDTGMFGDMSTIIERFYRPSLVVLNMSDQVTLGPVEAAFVIQSLVRPTTVMPSHVNEQATIDGVIARGTRVERFRDFLRGTVNVVVPLSGITFEFDGNGRCVRCPMTR
jgi:L-ascorbate metabolism protein UlaG (beta-lactamase superfamily)